MRHFFRWIQWNEISALMSSSASSKYLPRSQTWEANPSAHLPYTSSVLSSCKTDDEILWPEGLKLTEVLRRMSKFRIAVSFADKMRVFHFGTEAGEVVEFFHDTIDITVRHIHNNIIKYNYNYNNIGITHENITQRTALKHRESSSTGWINHLVKNNSFIIL